MKGWFSYLKKTIVAAVGSLAATVAVIQDAGSIENLSAEQIGTIVIMWLATLGIYTFRNGPRPGRGS